MRITRTQPLEHPTPVVPETEATVETGERPRTRRDEHSSAAADPSDDSTAGSRGSTDRPVDETYPQAPTGSAGHP
jgi:hypothetical protein